MLLSHALFVLNFLTLDMSGHSTADRLWHPKTNSSYAQVFWKDPLTGMWNGPDPFIIWANGSACTYNTKEGGARLLLERLIKPYNKFQVNTLERIIFSYRRKYRTVTMMNLMILAWIPFLFSIVKTTNNRAYQVFNYTWVIQNHAGDIVNSSSKIDVMSHCPDLEVDVCVLALGADAAWGTPSYFSLNLSLLIAPILTILDI